MPEPPTLTLNTGHATLTQSLGERGARHPCFVLYSGSQAGRRFVLDGETQVIGRAIGCEIQVDSAGISRRHAEVRVEPDRVVVADLGSSNGTLVNDRRIGAATALRDGDLVRLGHVLLRFYDRHSLDALLYDRVYELATVDGGTGVFTQRYLLEALEREIRLARHHGRPLALMCVDLDHFKSVNDRFGHNAGDAVLRECAARLKALSREQDIVGRSGGEEFVIVMPDTRALRAAQQAERLRAALAETPIAVDARGADGTRRVQHVQTASFGVAELGLGMADARALLAAADARLYAAKHGGRDRVAA